MPSQIDPPPPSFHHSPVQVLAARFSASLSNGFDGSPGVTKKRQSSRPLSTSKAERYPRYGGNSPPALPMKILPRATRGAIVIEYETESAGTVMTDQSSFPVAASSASSRPSITGTMTLRS